MILTLAAALLLGTLSGCGTAKADSSAETQPPAMVVTDVDGDEAASLEAARFQWDWLEKGSTLRAAADAVHPLDKNVLDMDELWFFEDTAGTYDLSFSREPSSLEFSRWDVEAIGDTHAEPLETAALSSPYKVQLQPGSVYLFHAGFDKVNGCGGSGDYYLIVPAADDAEEEEPVPADNGETEEEENMLFGGDEETFYWQTEEYAQWMEAVRQSAEIRGDMEGFYGRTLPLLLSGRENSVCSPLNLYLALAMLSETAGGESREAILSALNAPDLDTVRRNAALLWAANCYDLSVARCLLANSVWLNDSIPTSQAVSDALRDHHSSEIFSGIMGTEETDQRLRDWINEKTQDLLKEFVAGLKTQPETVMELVSTMYFKGAWSDKFNSGLTDRAVFHGLGGDTECDMMHRKHDTVFYWGENFTAVALGINEGGSMFFLLPNEGVSLESVISDPQAAALLRDHSAFENQKYVQVDMSIPKFDVKSDTDLRQAMTAMGMGDLFELEKADFSPLAAGEPVCLSQAEHAAGVTIDEEGVTGAAYTVFGLAKGAMPPADVVPFVLDRPFMFAVTARDGSMLFAGTVTDLAA